MTMECAPDNRQRTASGSATQEREGGEQRQRDTLVREVHHRIKNNLQGVAGLLRAHANAHPQLAPLLEGAIAQVNTVALIHGLQSRDPGDVVLLCQMVEAICSAAVGLTGTRMRPELRVHVDAPLEVAERESVPIALVINELVFNAIKHGDGSCHCEVLQEGDSRGRVRILNSGSRLPEDFDFEQGRGLGTGLELVRSLLPSRCAQLRYSSVENGVLCELVLESPIVGARGPV